MKSLIVIPSCTRDRAGQDAQRELLRGYDYRFFLGVGNSYSALDRDEVILPVRDDYMALAEKVRQAFGWALDHEYDYCFKCDRDTFIHPDRLMAALPEGKDYVGLVGNPGDCCGGGAGYWLSRHAMSVYLQNAGHESRANWAKWHNFEDWCVFTTLDRSNPKISPQCDRRYWDLRLGPVPDPETNITWNPWKP
jgi:hypothetical protein